MDTVIKDGICGKQEVEVNEKNTAIAFGSGDVEVFATPAMVALMEKTANESVKGLLPEGYVSVGIEINAKHIKASKLGSKIVCESFLSKVEGKKLTFIITAYDETAKIGEATHSRVVVEKTKFLSKL